MSGLRERIAEDSSADRAIEWLSAWYHVLIVVGLFGFMLWIRARTWEAFLVDGQVLLSGNDPWYHLRQISYTVTHWPATMPFDPWTEFPVGAGVEQFGTLFDQVIATTALILGLGSPSDHLIRLVTLFAPAVFGAAVIVPTYFLGKRLGGRTGGVVAAFVLAISAGKLLTRGLAGFADHQVAEVFFQAVAVLAILIAFRVAQAEKPIHELVVERDWQALRRPLGWGAVAGFALAVYLSVWPPGVMLIGILGVYVTLQLPIAFLRGESPEHIGIVAAVIFAVAGIVSLGTIDTIGLNAVKMSLLQPGLSFAGVAWVGVLSWLARDWERHDRDDWQYPVAVFGGLAVGVVAVLVVLPELFWYFVDQTMRFVGFTANPTAAASTVGEVQPLQSPRPLWRWYGTLPVIAGVGVLLAAVHQYVSEELDPTLLFVGLWFVFMLAATFTQNRFGYYLTVPIATLTAFVVTRLWHYLRSVSESSDLETYEVLVIVGLVFALIVPLVVPFPMAAMERSNYNGPGAGIKGWDSSLDWMSQNTPAVGNYGGAGNAEQLDFYGTYERTDDFQYPDGAYGVMSWWDYGHWITQEGKRIPVANPFQGNAEEAAAFLMAQNGSAARDAIAAVSDGPNASVRYAMVDWKMATANGGFAGYRWGKFFAPSAFLDNVSTSTYYRRVYALTQTQRGTSLTNRPFTVQKQAYYETMAVRLYRYHGSAASPTDVPGLNLRQIPVVDWQNYRGISIPEVTQNGTGKTVRWFPTRDAAESFVANDTTSQIGGLGKIPSESVSALEHYRLVQVSNRSFNRFYAIQPGLTNLMTSRQYQTGVGMRDLLRFAEPYPAWTKVFERVPGATVHGTAPANTTVTTSVEMRMPNANKTFTYRQHAETGPDGEFTMTLPYSTTGYSAVSPAEGYTNVSVRANGSYQFRTPSRTHSTNDSVKVIAYTDSADVSEEQVIGTDESVVEVELTESVLFEQDLNTTGDANETGENATDGTDSTGSDTTSTEETADSTTESVAPMITVGEVSPARLVPAGH